ncbi:MAG TPA: potassium/proton antiporter [Cyanobacteria bacterium UBA11369]|nr:potassium/proton antiporter [Cyanobacteria bacterium UBA11371]HBE31507.1 potassium/proton antiporter [Cyanobacteria bacterium UBA11368]HBE53017.1 potassium/proton antiporter [Cyanobacteria bacterium UBA11369]
MPRLEVVGLIVAGLLLASILASKISNQIGIPALLFFLIIGWVVGTVGGISLENPAIAKFIGDAALIFILFAGGLDTEWTAIKPVLGKGLSLSTIGVFITMLILGTFAWFILGSFSSFMIGVHGISFSQGLLLGAIVSSTDAAAVFSVLRSSHLGLKGNLKPLLELESGSNDPMAVLLTTTLINFLVGTDTSLVTVGISLVMQLVVGAAVGYGAGLFLVWAINRLNLSAQGLYPVATIALVLLTYSVTTLLGGNGFLAVYIAGVVKGNRPFVYQDTIVAFHDGIAWLMQIIMFLTLGMLSVPYQAELFSIASVAFAIALFLIFVARPISVFVSLAWTKMPFREKLFVAWVGLRGAVPIVLATFPLAVGMTQAGEIFTVVSFVVVTSVLIQGFSLATVARWLNLAIDE